MKISHDTVKKAILRSQHCQRNWDLSREVPKQDLELFASAVSQCPSKQNVSYYGVHFITNRSVIEEVHSKTDGFIISYDEGTSTTNPQVLANLLVAFESKEVELLNEKDIGRNQQTYDFQNRPEMRREAEEIMERDRNMAVGIAAGYLNLSASLLGYATGCCICFDSAAVGGMLKMKGRPLLLMGVGYRDFERSRLSHHVDEAFMFPTKNKQKIEITYLE